MKEVKNLTCKESFPMEYRNIAIIFVSIYWIGCIWSAEGYVARMDSSPKGKRSLEDVEHNPFAAPCAAILAGQSIREDGENHTFGPEMSSRKRRPSLRRDRSVSEPPLGSGEQNSIRDLASERVTIRRKKIPLISDSLWAGAGHMLSVYTDVFVSDVLGPTDRQDVKNAHEEFLKLSTTYATINSRMATLQTSLQDEVDGAQRDVLRGQQETITNEKHGWLAQFTTFKRQFSVVPGLTFLREVACISMVEGEDAMTREDKRMSRILWDGYGKLLAQLDEKFAQLGKDDESLRIDYRGRTESAIVIFKQLQAAYAETVDDSIERNIWMERFESFKEATATNGLCDFMKAIVINQPV